MNTNEEMIKTIQDHTKYIGGDIPLNLFAQNLAFEEQQDSVITEVKQIKTYGEMMSRIAALDNVDFTKSKQNPEKLRDFTITLMTILLQSSDVAKEMTPTQSALFSQLLAEKGCTAEKNVNHKLVGSLSCSNDFYTNPILIFSILSAKHFQDVQKAKRFDNAAKDLLSYLEPEYAIRGLNDGSIIGDWVSREINYAKKINSIKTNMEK